MLKQLLAALTFIVAALFSTHSSATPAHTARLSLHATSTPGAPHQLATTLAFGASFHPQSTSGAAQQNSPFIKSTEFNPTGAPGTAAVAKAATSKSSPAISEAASAGLVLGAQVSPTDAVTHAELTAALDEASNSLRQLVYAQQSAPNSLPATGGYTNSIALANRIDQLSGTKLSNITVNGVAGLTAADIPTGIVASNYLPLAGGALTGTLSGTNLTLSGNLTVSGAQTLSGAITVPYLVATSTATASSFESASTTLFSATGPAYFGATATSSFAANGALTLASALAVSSGGTGIASPATAGVLLGNYAGTGYQQLATSSLGLLTTNVTEGSNLYFTNARADARINATSSIGTLTAAPNLSTIATSLSGLVGANTGALYQIATSSNFVTSVAQTYGAAQTGTLTFATSSATTFNGLTVSHTITNAGTTFTFNAPTITGTLGVAGGGTGWAAIQSGAIPYGNGSSALSTTSAGTAGQVLALLNGAPTWTSTTTLSNISGTLAIGSGGTNNSSAYTSGSVIYSDGSKLTQDNTNFFWDAANHRLGIGTTSPAGPLQVKTSAANFLLVSDTSTYNGGTTLSEYRNGTIATAGLHFSADSETTGSILFLTNSGSGITKRARISPAGGFAFGSTYYATDPGANNMIVEGNVGIGQTSPTYNLDVTGLGHFTGLVDATNFVATSSSATSTFAGGLTGPNNFVIQQTSGNVGIGTTTPASGLTTQGGFLGVASKGTFIARFDSIAVPVGGSGIVISNAQTTEMWLGYGAFAVALPGPVVTDIGLASRGRLAFDSGGSAFATVLNPSGGSVGIGQTSPTYNLDVTGLGHFTGLVDAANFVATSSSVASTFGYRVGIGTTSPAQTLSVQGNALLSGNLSLANLTATGTFALTGTTGTSTIASGQGLTIGGSQFVLQQNSGWVGVGTANPTNLLQVAGLGHALKVGTTNGSAGTYVDIDALAAQQVGLNFNSAGTSNWLVYRPGNSTDLRFYDGTADRLTLQNGGNVGVGTTTPDARITVNSSAAAPGTAIEANTNTTNLDAVLGNYSTLRLVNYGTTANNYSTIDFADNNSSNDYSAVRLAGIYTAHSGSSLSGDFAVLTANGNGRPTERLRVTSGGNVGIGTSSPEATLTVVGSICAARGAGTQTTACTNTTGEIDASASSLSGGYDVAEAYPTSDASLQAGDIVTFDHSAAGAVIRAATADAAFLGVVSTDPALTLGAVSSSTRAIALAGRVPVKVNLDGGPIAIGDPIALSSVPGVGAKATTTEETIGVALAPYDGSGSSTIDVFVKPGLASPKSAGGISGFLGSIFSQIAAWLGSAGNGIGNLFAQTITATNVTAADITAYDRLCVGGGASDPTPVCVTKSQLAAVLSAAGTPATSKSVSSSSASSSEPSVQNPCTDCSISVSSTTPAGAPPTIQLNGANPAIIHVGDSYADLGATITGPKDADRNLGLKYFLNGELVNDIVLDTSKVATDTIDYVGTDPSGLTATSTRTVIIGAAVLSSPPPPAVASSTPAAVASSTPVVASSTAQ